MERRSAPNTQDRPEASRGHVPTDLKRLTRAELIRVICGPQTQIAGTPDKRSRKALRTHAPIMLVNGSVRSGQTVVFEQGDIVVVGSVNSGAEITAGGSIHVDGALRGKAHAGTSGGTGARIFCQRLEAELLQIDGLARRSDDLDSNLVGRPAHAWRELNHIGLAPLSTIPEVIPAEVIPAATELARCGSVAPPRPTWLSWARRVIRGASER